MLLKKPTSATKFVRFSLEPVFGVFILGYCRNMVVQHGGLRERGPGPYVDIMSSFIGNKNTILIFR